MEKKTYAEWKDAGFQVNRGEKASGRNSDGVAVFTKKQTKVRVYPRAFAEYGSNYYEHDGERIWNHMTEEEFLGYTPGDQ